MLAAGVLAIALVLALAVTWIVQPRPDATLRLIETSVEDQVAQRFGQAFQEVDSSTLQAHEAYLGIEPFSGVNEQGFPCLAAINLEEGVFFDVNCTPPGVDPSIEIVVLANRDDILADEFPAGSIIRLTLRHDVMNVIVHPAP